MKLKTASREHLEQHYCDLKEKKFFKSLVDFMASGPVVCMVWQGLDAVKQGIFIISVSLDFLLKD